MKKRPRRLPAGAFRQDRLSTRCLESSGEREQNRGVHDVVSRWTIDRFLQIGVEIGDTERQALPGQVCTNRVIPVVVAKQRQRAVADRTADVRTQRSEEHTSELQSLMRISYAVFCLKKKNTRQK